MSSDNKILKIIYTFFLGLLLAIFIGVGVNTFYPGPKAPVFPIELNSYGKDQTSEQINQQRQWDITMEQHNNAMKPYNRNVSIIVLIASVILLIISLAYEKKIRIMADGVMLGGLFSLIYSLGRGFASENSQYVFIVVTIGLATVLYLGFHRFVKGHVQADESTLKTKTK